MKIEEYMMLDESRWKGVRDRLAEKTRRNTENGCLEWVAKARANGGYGTICVGRRGQVRAHRAAWVFANGPIPDGVYICHRCDNPLCCDPDHLFLGTPKQNMADKEAKGRGIKPPTHFGQSHHNAKVADDLITAIINDPRTLHVIASDYGVSAKTIWRMKHNLTRVRQDDD